MYKSFDLCLFRTNSSPGHLALSVHVLVMVNALQEAGGYLCRDNDRGIVMVRALFQHGHVTSSDYRCLVFPSPQLLQLFLPSM